MKITIPTIGSSSLITGDVSDGFSVVVMLGYMTWKEPKCMRGGSEEAVRRVRRDT
jgi:hypothetical protein